MKTVLTVMGGLGAGVVLTLVVNGVNQPAEPVRGNAEVHSPAARPESPPAVEGQALLELERRMQRLEGRQRVAELLGNAEPDEAPTAAEEQQVARAPEPPSAAELSAVFEQVRAKHAAEPVDLSWASQAEEELAEDLVAIAAAAPGTELASLRCRSKSCEAELRWDSFDTAREGFRGFLHGGLSRNCARDILLPEPSAEAMQEPYSAHLVLECDPERAEALAQAGAVALNEPDE